MEKMTYADGPRTGACSSTWRQHRQGQNRPILRGQRGQTRWREGRTWVRGTEAVHVLWGGGDTFSSRRSPPSPGRPPCGDPTRRRGPCGEALRPMGLGQTRFAATRRRRRHANRQSLAAISGQARSSAGAGAGGRNGGMGSVGPRPIRQGETHPTMSQLHAKRFTAHTDQPRSGRFTRQTQTHRSASVMSSTVCQLSKPSAMKTSRYWSRFSCSMVHSRSAIDTTGRGARGAPLTPKGSWDGSSPVSSKTRGASRRDPRTPGGRTRPGEARGWTASGRLPSAVGGQVQAHGRRARSAVHIALDPWPGPWGGRRDETRACGDARVLVRFGQHGEGSKGG